MAVPIIITTQSVLSYLVGESFIFQPGAQNFPTNWVSSTMPPGLTLNEITGQISGAVTSPGVYNLVLYASNDDGQAMAEFCFGIEAGAASSGADVDIVMDIVSKAVALDTATALSSSITQAQTPDTEPPAVCTAKFGDDLIFNLRLAKNGTTVSPEVTAVKCTIKETDGDAALLTSTTFLQTGADDTTRYRILVPLTGDALKGAASDGSGDVQTREELLVEISLTYTNPTDGFGPGTLTLTTDNFGLIVVGSLQ